jgi:hypothetical protein
VSITAAAGATQGNRSAAARCFEPLERRTVGFVEPCLPSPAKAPPAGPDWLHEIKHDGFRLMARRDAVGVRLITRNGNDFTNRFPLVVAVVATLLVSSCLIDGEGIVSDDDGLAVFELIRSWATNLSAVLCAFELLAAKICAGCRSRYAKPGLPDCCASGRPASPLTSTTARRFFAAGTGGGRVLARPEMLAPNEASGRLASPEGLASRAQPLKVQCPLVFG